MAEAATATGTAMEEATTAVGAKAATEVPVTAEVGVEGAVAATDLAAAVALTPAATAATVAEEMVQDLERRVGRTEMAAVTAVTMGVGHVEDLERERRLLAG